MIWTLMCLLYLIPETDAANSLFLQHTWNPLRAGVRKFLLFQFEFPLWIFSPHKSFEDGSKRWHAGAIAEYPADMLMNLTPTKLITWNRRNNREWSPKTPAMMQKRNTVNERFAAWVRTAHGCLDTYRRRATIVMWIQVNSLEFWDRAQAGH